MGNSANKCIYIVLSIFLFMNFKKSNGLRILAVFPLPMYSMNIICEELMIGLAEKGHQVDVYSHFPPKKPMSNFTHFNLLGSLPAITNNLTFTQLTTVTLIDSMRSWIQDFGHAQCELLGHPHFQKLIKNPPKDPPYDLVIVEV